MSPPLVPNLNQTNPVHTIPSHLSEIHFNSIHPSTFSRLAMGRTKPKRPGREADHSPLLMPKSRKHGSIYPLPHTSSWRSAQLVKHRDNFNFYLRLRLPSGFPTRILHAFLFSPFVLHARSNSMTLSF
jgi:hypothetical protein